MAAAVTASPRTASVMDPPPTSATARRYSNGMPPPSSTAHNSSIKTPLSSTYPNHIHSPLRSTARKNNANDDVKTPVTPPSAYFDFLRILSPNSYTPSPLSTGTSTRFSHNDSNYPSPAWPSATLRDDKPLLRPTISSARSTSSSSSGASFSSASSAASSALSAAAGIAAASRDRQSAPPAANSSKPMQRPSELAFGRSYSAPEGSSNIATTTITASDPTSGTRTTEITRPHTARPAMQPGTPRLIIPPSPTSSVTQMSPAQHSAPATTANVPHSACPPSAMSATGAQSAAMRSAGGWTPASATGRETLWAKAAANSAGAPPSAISAGADNTASPGPWSRGKSPGAGGNSSPVTIKHVVTRTVTYHRRPGGPPVQGPARQGIGAAAARATVAQSPLSACEAIPEESEEEKKGRPLVGAVPRGKRRKIEA